MDIFILVQLIAAEPDLHFFLNRLQMKESSWKL